MLHTKYLSVIFFLTCASFAQAECPHLYPEQKTLHVPDTIELCNSWYVSRYNENERKVVLVSEIYDGKDGKIKRHLKFMSDDRVKYPVKNSEYTGTGWDRGHLSPSGNAGSVKEMRESFLLTNVVPQAPKLNRGDWRELEQRIRDNTKGSVYIITGAIYSGTSWTMSVPVPSALYKVVYFKKPEYWLAENHDDASVRRVSKEDLERLSGLKFP